MTEPTTPENPENPETPDEYRTRFGNESAEQLNRNTAARAAAYLLPHLKPGQRVLDYGCGPGRISVELARAVAPGGAIHCLDVDEAQVEPARALAASQGLDNLIFHVADVRSIPCEDDYFDVAHGNDVLARIPDTEAALAEIMRTLKPGGLIACRELICESCFTYPDLGVMRQSWDIVEDIIATDGGHPQMGKELKGHLAAAGFVDIRISGAFGVFATPAEMAAIHQLVHQWLLAPEVTETALSYGAGTEELFRRIGEACDRWLEHPAALCVLAYGEALAVKP